MRFVWTSSKHIRGQDTKLILENIEYNSLKSERENPEDGGGGFEAILFIYILKGSRSCQKYVIGDVFCHI